VKEFADQLRWRGARVLWGRCYELERSLLYQPIAEALRTILPTLSATELADLPAWVIAEVARLVPEISEHYPELAAPVPIQSDQEQVRLFNGVARFLAELAAHGSLLIVLEDLHWAGESTLQLIHYLIRRLADHQALVVGTLRPEEMGLQHPLVALRQQLKREGLCQPLRLECLSSEAVVAMVQEMSGAGEIVLPLAHRLYRETEGNPFFLIEIIKALFEIEVVRLEGGAWQGDLIQISVETLPLPAGVSEAIQGRVHRLDRETQEALRLAAVLGHEFDFDLLDTAWGQDKEATLRALDVLLRRRLINEGTGTLDRDYAFTHHKIQEVVYVGIPRRRRQYTHGLVGTAMEQLYKPQLVMSELAFHFEHAQHSDKRLTEKAVTYLRGAGEQAAAQYANAEAVSYLSRALNLTPKTNCAGRYAILLAREKVYHLQGTRESQSQDLQALEKLADVLDDDERRGEVALRQADYAGVTGDVPAAITAAQEAVRLGQAVQDVEMETAGHQRWGQILRRKGDYEAARTQIEAALALARSASLHALEAESLWELGSVLSGLSDYANATTLYEQSLSMCRKIGDRLGEGKVLGNLGHNFSYYRSDYDRSEAYHKQALRIHREIGNRRSESRTLVNMGINAAKLGDYARARGYYEQAQEIAHEIDDPWTESSTHNNLGIVARRLGDYTGARLHFEQALRISREIGKRQLEGTSLTQLGNVSRYQGDYSKARAYFEQALSVNRQIGSRRGESTSLGSLGLTSRDLGNYAQARIYFEQALQITREIGVRQNEGIWLANLSLLCHRLEEYRDALVYGEQALAIFQDLGDRPNQGYALTYLGHARKGLRHLDEAATAYQQALDLRRELEQPHLATEPLAGLARISLAQGDLPQAQNHVEEILRHLETGALDGTDEPFRVYLTCYQVLHASGDPRAQEILTTVYNLLQEQAAKITDEELHRSFLESIVVHREIVAAMADSAD
jgi:tetratricopeptide (TPR) repeat protein